jgi:hypothetical protein
VSLRCLAANGVRLAGEVAGLICGKIARMNKEFLWALIFLGVGVAMLQDPKCQRGCRTVAEHLLSHGIDDFLATLGA